MFTRPEENGDAAVEGQGDGTLWPELEGNGEGGDENGDVAEEPQVSEWKLEEVGEFTRELEVYRRRRRRALAEAIRERDGNGRYVSRLVLTLWEYQRSQLRLAG